LPRADGRIIFTVSEDGARFWDAATGRPLGPRRGNGKYVWAGAFRPDGHVFAMAQTGVVRFGAVPKPMSGPIARIKREIELISGMELEEQDTYRELDARSLSQPRQQLDQEE
jgi:hypothetical protein